MAEEKNDDRKGMDLDVIDLSSLLKKQPVEKDTKDSEERKDPEPLPEKDTIEPTKDMIEAPDASQVKFTTGDAPQKSKFYILFWCLPVVIGLSVLIFYFTGVLSTQKGVDENAPEPLKSFILDVKRTTSQLQKSTNHLDTVSNKINSPKKIIQILDAIKIVGDILPVYEMRIQNLTHSTQKNKKDLQEKGLGVLVEIGDYYSGKTNTHYLQLLKKCIAVQKKYLTYYYDKYDLIIKRQQPQIQSYEAFYLQYKRAFGEYEKANTAQINFIKTFLEKYPSTEDFFLYDKKNNFFSWTT